MIIYPAIDLIGGAVVRLHKGDFDQSRPMAIIQFRLRNPMLMPAQHGFIWLILMVPKTRITARLI
jgi:phosphoribosylformimino-5-aminoimidazole carboxamide ribonucleotide (ProFAR) isomerase